MRKAARRAKVKPGVHILRQHTFCSHLAMCAALARAIQELAGHQDLGTTQRYMDNDQGQVSQGTHALLLEEGEWVTLTPRTSYRPVSEERPLDGLVARADIKASFAHPMAWRT